MTTWPISKWEDDKEASNRMVFTREERSAVIYMTGIEDGISLQKEERLSVSCN
jgi:hypothetical protein